MHGSNHWAHAEIAWRNHNNTIMNNGVIASKYGLTIPWRRLWRDRIVPAMRRKCSSSHPQSAAWNTEDDLKILVRILSFKPFKITSLLHAHDVSLYVCIQIVTFSIRAAEESHILQRFDCLFGWTSFNPHLLSNQTVRGYERYLLRPTSICVYRVNTLWRVFRRSFLSRSGVIFTQTNDINTGESIGSVAVGEGQEVESYDKTRIERVS